MKKDRFLFFAGVCFLLCTSSLVVICFAASGESDNARCVPIKDPKTCENTGNSMCQAAGLEVIWKRYECTYCSSQASVYDARCIGWEGFKCIYHDSPENPCDGAPKKKGVCVIPEGSAHAECDNPQRIGDCVTSTEFRCKP